MKARLSLPGLILAAFFFSGVAHADEPSAQAASPSPGTTPTATPTPQANFHPGETWPDDGGVPINAHGGGLLFHDGLYYWFGEHKIAGPRGNSAQVGVHCYSSPDLYHWKDEGIALPVSEDRTSDIARGCIIERPKVLFNARTRKFVLWFHLELRGRGYGAARCGVAVSDHPTGPYVFQSSFRPDAGAWPLNVTDGDRVPGPRNWLARDLSGGQMARDLTLFADDDGQAYAIFSSEENQTLHVSQLSDDYLGTVGRYSRVLPGGANEAPVLFKREGKYYLITSGTTGWAPNAARSAVADHVFGPYRPLGNPCRGDGHQTGTTFESQGTFALLVNGKQDAVIFGADRWRPQNPIDGRYVWLPVEWKNDKPILRWQPTWDLSFFDRQP